MRSTYFIIIAVIFMIFASTTSSAQILQGMSIYDGRLPDSGHSWSGIFKRACADEPFNLGFNLNSIQGGFHVNINMAKDSNNRYAVGFMNLGNGSMSVYLFEEYQDETYIIDEKLFPLEDDSIIYLRSELIESRAVDSEFLTRDAEPVLTETNVQVRIEYDDGYLQVFVSRPGQEIFRPLIEYSFEDPLPPGYIDFETLEGSSANLSEVYTSCTQEIEESRYMGIAYFKEPDPSFLIDATSDENDPLGVSWGEVPANQILVRMDDAISFEEARNLARQLADRLTMVTGQQASLVGEFEYINLFQIETRSRTLDELIRDVSIAMNFDNRIVDAFPNDQIYPEAPLADNPHYRDSTIGAGYSIIGVQEAWDDIAASNLKLSRVKVGIVDDGIYLQSGQFNQADINTSLKIYHPVSPPSILTSRKASPLDTAGSHGTGVANMLAANTDGRGLQGIASILPEDKLRIFMINVSGRDRSFVTSSMLAFQFQIQNGSSIISCSMGNTDNINPGAPRTYNQFFLDLSKDERFDDVLFIFSAGNEGKEIDGKKRIPNGLPMSKSLPNVITVGNIMNDGTTANHQIVWTATDTWEASSSNKNSQDFPDYVTLAAPGEQAFWGWDDSRGSLGIMNRRGGTSMAAPEVTAAAVLMRSINPCLTAAEIKDILMRTASNGPNANELGGRILSISRAVNEAISRKSTISCDPFSSGLTVILPGDLNNFGRIWATGDIAGMEIRSAVYRDSNPQILYCQEGNIILVYNRIYLAGPGLNEVNKVTYYLHETFPDPVRISTDRANDFEIWIMSWGSFPIRAEIETASGIIEKEYDFSFRTKMDEATSNGVPMVLVPCDADLSGWGGGFPSGPVSGSSTGNEPPIWTEPLSSTGFETTINIISESYRGYTISVDGLQIGVEGQGRDPLDGRYTFTVAGNQWHTIMLEHPLDWKRWNLFYSAGETETYNF